MISAFFSWIASLGLAWIWAWVEAIAYWVACIGCVGCVTFFVATHDKRFSKTCVILVVAFAMVEAVGSVL